MRELFKQLFCNHLYLKAGGFTETSFGCEVMALYRCAKCGKQKRYDYFGYFRKKHRIYDKYKKKKRSI